MNDRQAIETLTLFRPGTVDVQDPDFAIALGQTRHNADLSRWLESHCARYEAIRAKFQEIPVPAGLKEQILSERRVRAMKVSRRQAAVMLLAAFVIAVLVVTANWWLNPSSLPRYRTKMVSTALRGYGMDMRSSDLGEIRQFITQHKGHGDFALTPSLERTPGVGCKLLTWEGQQVSMICFKTGRPLSPGEESDLFLFVIDRSALRDAPRPGKSDAMQVNKLMTVTWSEDGKTYILAGYGDEQFIRGFL